MQSELPPFLCNVFTAVNTSRAGSCGLIALTGGLKLELMRCYIESVIIHHKPLTHLIMRFRINATKGKKTKRKSTPVSASAFCAVQ